MGAPGSDPPPAEGYVYELCKSEAKFRLLFMFSVAGAGIMLVWILVALAVPSLGAGSGSFVIAVVNLVVAGTLAAVSGYFVRRCSRRRAQRRAAYRESANES